LLLTAAVVSASACGATTRSGSVTTSAGTAALTGAAVSFRTLKDGKDDQSTLTVEVVRRNDQLGAQLRVVDVEFNDNSQTTPMALSVVGMFRASDIDDGMVRLRMNAHGDDEWSFDMHLTLTFSDNTQRTFSWLGLELDDDHPERTVSLSSGRTR
jgi:hypothetical protein